MGGQRAEVAGDKCPWHLSSSNCAQAVLVPSPAAPNNFNIHRTSKRLRRSARHRAKSRPCGPFSRSCTQGAHQCSRAERPQLRPPYMQWCQCHRPDQWQLALQSGDPVNSGRRTKKRTAPCGRWQFGNSCCYRAVSLRRRSWSLLFSNRNFL